MSLSFDIFAESVDSDFKPDQQSTILDDSSHSISSQILTAMQQKFDSKFYEKTIDMMDAKAKGNLSEFLAQSRSSNSDSELPFDKQDDVYAVIIVLNNFPESDKINDFMIKQQSSDSVSSYESMGVNEKQHAQQTELKQHVRQLIENKSNENKDNLIYKLINNHGVTKYNRAETLSFVTALVPIEHIPKLAEYDYVYKIGDGEKILKPQFSTLDEAKDLIGVFEPNVTGFDGTGIVVAIVDTGIDVSHPALPLGTKVIDRAICIDVSECDPDQFFIHSPIDHGTSIASIVSGFEVPGFLGNSGVAPDSSLIDLMTGDGTVVLLGDYVNALDYAITNNANILQTSLVTPSCSIFDVAQVIEDEAVEIGLHVIAAAGNTSFDPPTNIETFGCSYNGISVGAVNSDGTIWDDRSTGGSTSARGPTFDGRLKPDLVAYGKDILAAKDGIYVARTGTSFAAPMVSGASALILERASLDPGVFSPEELKSVLLAGSQWKGPVPMNAGLYESNGSVDDDLNKFGHGILDVSKSIQIMDDGNVLKDVIFEGQTKNWTLQANEGETVKIVMTWLHHPFGLVQEDPAPSSIQISNLDFEIKQIDGTLVASSNSVSQNVEFVVFEAPATSTYSLTITAPFVHPFNVIMEDFAIASSHTILAETPPDLPTVNAGNSIGADEGSIISKSGSAHTNPVGGAITQWSWSQEPSVLDCPIPNNLVTFIGSQNVQNPQIQLPFIPDGTVESCKALMKLTVEDEFGLQNSDTVLVTIFNVDGLEPTVVSNPSLGEDSEFGASVSILFNNALTTNLIGTPQAQFDVFSNALLASSVSSTEEISSFSHPLIFTGINNVNHPNIDKNNNSYYTPLDDLIFFYDDVEDTASLFDMKLQENILSVSADSQELFHYAGSNSEVLPPVLIKNVNVATLGSNVQLKNNSEFMWNLYDYEQFVNSDNVNNMSSLLVVEKQSSSSVTPQQQDVPKSNPSNGKYKTIQNPILFVNDNTNSAYLYDETSGALLAASDDKVGAAFVYDQSGALALKIQSPSPFSNERFGDHVTSLNENPMIGVIRDKDDSGLATGGAVYVYDANSGDVNNQTNQPILYIPNPDPNPFDMGDLFGSSIATTSNNKILIGAPQHRDITLDLHNAGVVHVYDDSVGTFNNMLTNNTPLLSIDNPDTVNGDFDRFGQSVATLSDNSAVIGASGANVVYVFPTDVHTLSPTLIIPNPAVTPGDFGQSVDVTDNDHILVGAPKDDSEGTDTGRVYLFDGTTGNLLLTIKNPDPSGGAGSDDDFGFDVQSFGDYIIIGAPKHDVGIISGAGSVYLFDARLRGITDIPLLIINNQDPHADDNFGQSVDTDGTKFLIGAPNGHTPILPDVGTVNNFEPEISLPVVPEIPTGLMATSFDTDQIFLEWTAPANDGGYDITGYKIDRESPVGNGFVNLVPNTGSTLTTFTDDDNLSPHTQYNYQVSAINGLGSGNPSIPSSTQTFDTPPEINILQPTDNSTITTSNTTISGTATDVESGITQVSISVDSSPEQTATGTTTWSFDATNLSDGVHTITATATNGEGLTHPDTISFTVDTTLPPPPPTSNLLVHHTFENNLLDSSALQNDATISAGGTEIYTTAGIVDAAAFDFDGNTNLNVPNESDYDFEHTDPFSISLWFNSDDLATATSQPLLVKASGLGRTGYSLYLDNSDHLVLSISNRLANPDELQVLSSGFTAAQDTWYHVSVTYDGTGSTNGISSVQMYIDGVPQTVVQDGATGTVTQSILNNSSVRIGGMPSNAGNQHLYGALDDIRIYDGVLTQQEVDDLYALGN